MKNQLSENQLDLIAELFILAIKANNVAGHNTDLYFDGSSQMITLKINNDDGLEYHEKLKISDALPIFEWIMKRWEKQLLDVIQNLKPTA